MVLSSLGLYLDGYKNPYVLLALGAPDDVLA
jgi:hypothetical protein